MTKKRTSCFAQTIEEIATNNKNYPHVLGELNKIKQVGSNSLLTNNEVLSCVKILHQGYMNNQTYDLSKQTDFLPQNTIFTENNLALLLKSIILYRILYPDDKNFEINQINLIPTKRTHFCTLY